MKVALRRRPQIKIALRAARPVDYGFARQLYRELMHDITDALFGWDEYREDMSFARQFVLREARIITRAAKDIGWIQTRIEGPAMHLLQFYIAPPWQHRGFGTEVLQRLLAEAKRRRKLMALSVVKGNPAIRFYLRHGFRPVAEDRYKIYLRQERARSLRGIGPTMGMQRG